MLRAIVDRLHELNEQAAAIALYRNVIEGTDNDGKQYFKLVNESPKPFFQNELQALKPEKLKKPQNEEEELLRDAYELLKKKLKDFKLEGHAEVETIKAVRDQVLNYLKFILVTAKSEDDAYTIFETLNARGLSLTSVDLIKNWIFKNYDQTHPNDNAKDLWSDLRKSISSFSDLETFFRHYWNSKYAFASDDRLYKSFKDFLKKGLISDAKSFLLEVQSAADLYRKIGAPQDNDWTIQKERVIKHSFDLLNQYRVTQVRPFLLALLECRGKKLIDQTTLITVIANLENFHFVFSNLCQDRASGLEGKYTRAAKNLHQANTDKVKVKQVIDDLIDYLAKKRPNAKRIEDSLSELIFKSGEEVSKKSIQTIFSKVERALHKTRELLVGSFSLEHIQDQSTQASWIGSLGNLLPLDENINNKIKPGTSFKVKKSQYKNSSMKTVAEFLNANPQDNWGEDHSKAWLTYIAKKVDEATQLQKL